ncbi:hypothetical protein U1707_18650 [Sphingomonas sp. PB2P12]|uniref:hypothetical protein n=1 Tax=Sphingomonas sandaracina TaxID=3096157 RepID=UPI002FC94137
MTQQINDNNAIIPFPKLDLWDPHGRAALLLVESLLHTLIERSALRVEDVLDVITVAIDANEELAADRGEREDPTDQTTVVLSAILHSLSHDIG